MKTENEEGYFDRNGNYVENKPDRDDVQDGWLDEYDDKWAKKVSTSRRGEQGEGKGRAESIILINIIVGCKT